MRGAVMAELNEKLNNFDILDVLKEFYNNTKSRCERDHNIPSGGILGESEILSINDCSNLNIVFKDSFVKDADEYDSANFIEEITSQAPLYLSVSSPFFSVLNDIEKLSYLEVILIFLLKFCT